MSIMRFKQLKKYNPLEEDAYLYELTNGYHSRKFSPKKKTIEKCRVINFYTYIIPTIMGESPIRITTHCYAEFAMLILGLSGDMLRFASAIRRSWSFKTCQ